MIEIKDLSKRLKNREVLKNVNFSFEKGKIYGIYGRNGSGKTMLIRAISGLLYPTYGEIKIDGKVLHRDISCPPSLGVIIENTGLLTEYDAFTNLKILSKINKKVNDQDIKRTISRVGLDSENKLKVKKFSLGMKQRLSVAQAILEKPDLLLLDEPTNAIDEQGVREIYKILQEERERGATIILASHHREDLTVLADICLKMDNGKIVHDEK